MASDNLVCYTAHVTGTGLKMASSSSDLSSNTTVFHLEEKWCPPSCYQAILLVIHT